MDTLAGTSWTLEQSGVTQTLAFAEGRASGSGGCNRFSGAYEEDGTSIFLGPLMTTRMACADEVMDAEQAYFAALGRVASWAASAEELVLFDATGDEILRYNRTGEGGI